MKLNRILGRLFIFSLLAINFTSCISQPLSPAESTTVLLPITSTPLRFTKSPDITAFPSRTPPPTETGTFTPVAPTTATPTPLPTFDTQERGKIIEELIQTNAGCKLPCVWGITPGKSTWTDSTRFFSRMRAIFETDSKAIINYTLTFDASAKGASYEHFYNVFTFSTLDKTGVDLIDVVGNGGEIPTEFPRLWEAYSPERIISTYGEPSRMFLSSEPNYFGDTGKVGYFLWLFYDEQGFMIRYDGSVNFAPMYHFCPIIQNKGEIDSIHLGSINLRKGIALEKQDEIFESGYHKVLTFEEATGQTIDEFARLFLQNEKPACFNVSREVWQ